MKLHTLTACGLFLLPALALAAGHQEIQLAWSDLSSLIVAQQVALVLPDTTRIRGRAIAVLPDALELYVAETSNRRLHPKGQVTIPRSTVSQIELRERRRRNFGEMVGGIAGLFGGASAGLGLGLLMPCSDLSCLPPAMLMAVGGAVIGTIVGSHAGRDFDWKITILKIRPPEDHPKNSHGLEAVAPQSAAP